MYKIILFSIASVEMDNQSKSKQLISRHRLNLFSDLVTNNSCFKHHLAFYYVVQISLETNKMQRNKVIFLGCNQCLKCSNFKKIAKIQKFKNFIQLFLSSIQQDSKEKQYIREVQQKITQFTNSKVSINFSLLQKEKNSNILSQQALQRLSQAYKNIYMKQIKHWMINFQSFQQIFGCEPKKEVLTVLAWVNYCHWIFENLMSAYLRKDLIVSKVPKTQNSNIYFFQKELSLLMKFHQQNNQLRKKAVYHYLNNIQYLMQTQKDESALLSYYQKASDVLNVYSQNEKMKFKFLAYKESIKDYNTNLQMSIAVLRNPGLSQSGYTFEEQKYQDQFINLQNGQNVYLNQYRYDLLCVQPMDLQRSPNALIGHQFLNFNRVINKACEVGNFLSQQTKNPKIFSIFPYLRQNQTLYLKLRLTSQEFDVFELGLKWYQMDQKCQSGLIENKIQIAFKIVPDSGQNSINYGLINEDKKKITKFLTYQNRENETEKIYLALQDDIIGIRFCYQALNFQIFNFTRGYTYLNQKIFSLGKVKIINQMYTFPLSVFIQLSTQVCQIQIVDQK